MQISKPLKATLLLSAPSSLVAIVLYSQCTTMVDAWVPIQRAGIHQQHDQPMTCAFTNVLGFQKKVATTTTKIGITNDERIGEKYVLDDESANLGTSGKTSVYKAYERCPSTGEALKDQQVVIKFSRDEDRREALEREANALEGLNENFFVETREFLRPQQQQQQQQHQHQQELAQEEVHDTYHNYGGNEATAGTAIIMECGDSDLRAYIDQRGGGGLKGEELRHAAFATAKCVQNLHDQNMVWTELKSENLVRFEDGTVKGIDVESAVPKNGNPIDFTPKGCPPEFAVRYLCGTEMLAEMTYDYDIWSYGMVLFELATGRHYFEGQDDVEILKALKNTNSIQLQKVEDNKLKDLLSKCFSINPKDRPSINNVLQHEYFNGIMV